MNLYDGTQICFSDGYNELATLILWVSVGLVLEVINSRTVAKSVIDPPFFVVFQGFFDKLMCLGGIHICNLSSLLINYIVVKKRKLKYICWLYINDTEKLRVAYTWYDLKRVWLFIFVKNYLQLLIIKLDKFVCVKELLLMLFLAKSFKTLGH